MKTNRVTEGPLRHHVQKAFNMLMSPPPHSYVSITRIHPRTGVEIPIEVDYYISKDRPEVQLGDAINKRTGSEVWLSSAEKQQATELAWQDMKEMGKLPESRMIRTTVATLRSVVRRLAESYDMAPSRTVTIFRSGIPIEVEYCATEHSAGDAYQPAIDSEIEIYGAAGPGGEPVELTPEEESTATEAAWENEEWLSNTD